MIVPIISGLLSWRKAPITWIIVVLNILILMGTTFFGLESQRGLEQAMKGKYFLSAQGRVYAQYLDENSRQEYPTFLRELASQVHTGSNSRAEMLGQLAFRDLNFMNAAPSLIIEGDQVAFRYWQKRIHEVRAYQETHPSFALGLTADESGLGRWLSYIFVHSGWLHLASNLLFLFIFGAALERQIGGLGFLVVFLLSGVFAAGVFALATGVTSAPLVGASGAVSGVMAMFCFINWNQPVRYFYWFFLPFRGFMGFVFLPAWVALVLWMLSDLAGYFGNLAELGGIAYTAHLGGEAAGLIAGAILWATRRHWPLVQQHENLPIETGKLYPLI